MMRLNGYFGHWESYLGTGAGAKLLAGAWIGLGALFALAFGLLARVGAWKERRK